MLSADGVVFATPVYVHTVSALLKNFFDRFAYMCHQPRFHGKSAMFVVTTELSGAEETLEYMRFPAFTWGFHLSCDLDVVYNAYLEPGKYHDMVTHRISKVARKFYQDMTLPLGAPTFRELAFFHLMRHKVTFHKEMLPYDYQYWKEQGWLSRSFYEENDIPSLKNGLARLLVKRKVKRLLRTYGLEQSQG
jgi:multimeric flavodoxin WrbA